MRLFEIASSRFFLATSHPQIPGEVVSVQGTVQPLGAALENRLEGTRPEGQLARASSLYLHPQQPPRGAYIYEVEADGRVVRHHASWLRQLRATSFGSEGAIDQLCRAYWSGKECPEERDLPWEYRALQATILRRVGGSALIKVS